MLKITEKICKKLLCAEDFDLGSDSSLYLCGLVKQSAVRNRDFGLKIWWGDSPHVFICTSDP